MRVQLSENAREFLGKSELIIITERVDDVVLLIGQMMKMGLVEAVGQAYSTVLESTGLESGVDGSGVVGVHLERGRPS